MPSFNLLSVSITHIHTLTCYIVDPSSEQPFTSTRRGQILSNSLYQTYINDAFPDGLRYRTPFPLLQTSGQDWVFQPHPKLYEMLAENTIDHYRHYMNNKIDKAAIPSYFFIGPAGSGKSRNGAEFGSAIREAVRLHANPPCDELTRRLERAFVFNVSFENGTPLGSDETELLDAIGIRMLHQLRKESLIELKHQFGGGVHPENVFKLLAAAENVDFYEDFTGILVVDGIQRAMKSSDDGKNKYSPFYQSLALIHGLSLSTRHLDETSNGDRRSAPFIITCITGTFLNTYDEFLADSHRKRIFLPIARLEAPIRRLNGNEIQVIQDSHIAQLLISDSGGHARALELIADEFEKYEADAMPEVGEIANSIFKAFQDRYSEAMMLLQADCVFSIVQCVLFRKLVRLQDKIPESNLTWERVTGSGLIWFEKFENDNDYSGQGYLVAPYIWLWLLARLPAVGPTEYLCRFLKEWKFNDYSELLYVRNGKGAPGNTTWQSFEVFCCLFRILRSQGFSKGQKTLLKDLHSGCKFRDDNDISIQNRHLKYAKSLHQHATASRTKSSNVVIEARECNDVGPQASSTLTADDQLGYVILNGDSAPAGDFFLNIKLFSGHNRKRKRSSQVIREIGQCKLITRQLTQADYNAERKKAASSQDFFMLYTTSDSKSDLVLPDRYGLVDQSCWESYFGPFAGRAYMAAKLTSRK
jgi:hypothetical protein